jgi:hypothetical protein
MPFFSAKVVIDLRRIKTSSTLSEDYRKLLKASFYTEI